MEAKQIQVIFSLNAFFLLQFYYCNLTITVNLRISYFYIIYICLLFVYMYYVKVSFRVNTVKAFERYAEKDNIV